ncbi:hypothetical protein [Sphingobacterium sp. LRF_L2]|uniref:hypothetical protein n=1 Tax=Sphingobacterium sp. LRF_L2 TaxID=3369421 RepID=UPI003F5EFC19
MLQTKLLKPFPFWIHLLICSTYIVVIAVINVVRYGWQHLGLVIYLIPVMVGITYLNRYLFKVTLTRGIHRRRLLSWLACFVLLMVPAYIHLYVFPNSLTRILVKDPSAHRFYEYLIDFFAFYFNFAIKGVLLVLAELIINLVSSGVRRMRKKRLKRKKEKFQKGLREWLNHLVGNIAQNVVCNSAACPNPTEVSVSYTKLSARVAQWSLADDLSVCPLEEEIDHLRLMSKIYWKCTIGIELPESIPQIDIFPFVLVSLYKNMCKHGDFAGDCTGARFVLRPEGDCLKIHTENLIADASVWTFGEGKTGLRSLKRLLKEKYRDTYTLRYFEQEDRFVLELIIPINLKNKLIAYDL